MSTLTAAVWIVVAWTAAAALVAVGWSLGRRTAQAVIAHQGATIARLQQLHDRCPCQPRHPSTGLSLVRTREVLDRQRRRAHPVGVLGCPRCIEAAERRRTARRPQGGDTR